MYSVITDIPITEKWRIFSSNLDDFPCTINHDDYVTMKDLLGTTLKNVFDIDYDLSDYFDSELFNYEKNSYVYGILKLNNKDYIVHVDNEFTIKIVGDTESNWPYFLFCLDDDPDKFEVFMKECETKLGIPIKNPDFDGLYAEIEEKFLTPLIFNVN